MNISYTRATEKEYWQFCKCFPFSCVDLIIFQNDAILLTKRTRKPFKGKWHLPGSMIRKNERMKDAIQRTAKEELNLYVKIEEFLGVYESLDSFRHDLSHAFIISILRGKIKPDFQSSDLKFFKKIPSNVIPIHYKMIQDAKTLHIK